jgi:two-component system OmpR family response regulator
VRRFGNAYSRGPGSPQETERNGAHHGGMDRAARILVVEDDENVRFVTVAALRQASFDVEEVPNGRDALRRLNESSIVPDLVVLDVLLPDLDGFEVCRRIRSEGVDVPVVFLTARDATEDRLRGLTIGGDDYLTKPFSVEELVARVQVILRRVGKEQRATLVIIGDVELDDDARTVRKSGIEVPLSPTEYKLLRFLMRNAGKAMSRGQILDHVWDYDFEGESTVVETFVSSLRKKLDGDGRRLIHTVRGIGYRLQADTR